MFRIRVLLRQTSSRARTIGGLHDLLLYYCTLFINGKLTFLSLTCCTVRYRTKLTAWDQASWFNWPVTPMQAPVAGAGSVLDYWLIITALSVPP